MSSTKNRQFWNAIGASYQATHAARLAGDEALAWGVWRIPEAQLQVLGDVNGKRVLEVGCGAAQWTSALATRGARAYGIDLSEQQLRHAPKALPLAQANAERLPFAERSFDITFCDHGAATFTPPRVLVPEVARVLKPGCVFAFCMSTPIRDMCFDAAADAVTPRLAIDYFSLSSFDDGRSVEYQLPYGDWIRLFRQHGFTVEDLIEIRPPEGAQTTFDDYVPAEWARRWPGEHIWKVRKAMAT